MSQSTKKRGSGLGNASAEQVLTELLREQRFPLLNELLDEHAHKDALRAELASLVRAFVPDRAPRRSVKVVGKMLRRVAGVDVEDAVVVRDVSETGLQLAVSTQLGLSATDLTEVRLRLRLPTGQDTVARATLVRVIHSDQNFIVGGFRFVELESAAARTLNQIKSAHSLRAAEIVEARRSQVPPRTLDSASGKEPGKGA